MTPNDIVLLVVAYLVGSIPFGLLLGKAMGLGDIRSVGSGNIGATNMVRLGGKKLGAITLLLDMTKGFVAVSALSPYMTSDVGPMLLGLYATLGHIYPIWLKFKGGKGVATALGVLLAIHFVLGMAVIVTWLLTFAASRISSLSAIAALLLAPFIYGYFSYGANGPLWIAALSALVIFKHHENIARLLKGEEHRFSFDKKDDKEE